MPIVHIAMKVAGNFGFIAFLRREIALNIRDQINQHTKQYGDLDDIIEEELEASADAAGRVHLQGAEQMADQGIQPLHAENLICDELSHQEQHPPSSFGPQPQQVSPSINSLNRVSVSQFKE